MLNAVRDLFALILNMRRASLTSIHAAPMGQRLFCTWQADLEGTNFCCVGHMRAPTELHGHTRNVHNSHHVPILLSKHGYGTCRGPALEHIAQCAWYASFKFGRYYALHDCMFVIVASCRVNISMKATSSKKRGDILSSSCIPAAFASAIGTSLTSKACSSWIHWFTNFSTSWSSCACIWGTLAAEGIWLSQGFSLLWPC